MRELVCRECGVAIEKPPYSCRDCDARYKHEWYLRRKAAGFRVSGSKTWDPKKRAAWFERRKTDPAVRAKRREMAVAYRNRPDHAIKIKARRAVNTAMRFGRLTAQSCELCGTQKAQAHHEDYLRPLDVRWLCAKCHTAEHLYRAKAEMRDEHDAEGAA